MSGMDREGDSPRDAQDIPLHVVSHRVLRSANVQIILGLPLGRKKLFLRRGFPLVSSRMPGAAGNARRVGDPAGDLAFRI